MCVIMWRNLKMQLAYGYFGTVFINANIDEIILTDWPIRFKQYFQKEKPCSVQLLK